jgi:hypothetical protein
MPLHIRGEDFWFPAATRHITLVDALIDWNDAPAVSFYATWRGDWSEPRFLSEGMERGGQWTNLSGVNDAVFPRPQETVIDVSLDGVSYRSHHNYGVRYGAAGYYLYDSAYPSVTQLPLKSGRSCECYAAFGMVSAPQYTSPHPFTSDYGASLGSTTLVSDHIRIFPMSDDRDYLVMFAPLQDGTLSKSGVCIAKQVPLQNKRPSGEHRTTYYHELAVDYTRQVLPSAIELVEVGQFSGSTFTPLQSIFVWSTSPGGYFERTVTYASWRDSSNYGPWWSREVRACLARSDIYAGTDTRLVVSIPCVSQTASYNTRDAMVTTPYASGEYSTHYSASCMSMSIPFKPDSRDHSVLMEKDATTGVVPNNYTSTRWKKAHTSFDVGEFPALRARIADHASLSMVSFVSGSPIVLSTTTGIAGGPNTEFSNTLKSNGGLLLPCDSPTDSTETSTVQTIASSTGGVWSVTGSTQAVASCVSAHSPFVDRSLCSDHSEYVDESPSDGSIVLAGKKVVSVEILFTPYAKGSAVPTGVTTASSSGTLSGYTTGDPSSASTIGNTLTTSPTAVGGVLWKKSGDVPLPPGGMDSLTGSTTKVGYSGNYWQRQATAASTLSTTSYASWTAMTTGQHDDMVVAEHCRLIKTLPWTDYGNDVFARDYPYSDKRSLKIAPLYGRYTLSRFSVGSIPAAGNIFRFSGSGAWSVTSKTLNYNFWCPGTAVTASWASAGGSYYTLSYATANSPIECQVSEQWSLRTDHVELYAALATGLQEHGKIGVVMEGTETAINDSEIRSPDAPLGRVSAGFAIHEPASPPRPTLHLCLSARTVMRGSCHVEVTSPAGNSVSMDSNVDAQCGAFDPAAIGNAPQFVDPTSGPDGIDSQTTYRDHIPIEFTPIVFNADQTASLLAGNEVTATCWDSRTDGGDGRPVIIDLCPERYTTYGTPSNRFYSVSLKLNLVDL